jgi:CRP-like cAMP-binding protein
MLKLKAELFEGLAAEDAQEALGLGVPLTVARGAELFRLGDEADRIFLVSRGRLRLTMPMQVRGCEQDVLVEELGPGQTVGWSALIPPYRFTLTATAPLESEVIALSRESLQRYFQGRPEIGCAVFLNLAAVVGQRLHLFQTMWLREMERMVELRCA